MAMPQGGLDHPAAECDGAASQATQEDSDDDSQLLYSESRKRAGMGSPRADDGRQAGCLKASLMDPEETDDEAPTEDERATFGKEATARKVDVLAALPQLARELGTSSEEREEGSAPPSPILMHTAQVEAAKAIGAQKTCLVPRLASAAAAAASEPAPLFPQPPPSFQATTCGSELKRDVPEQAGAQVAAKETGGDETGVGKKRGARPAQADQQDLRQESQEPPSK